MAAAPAGSGPRAARLATPTRIYQRGSYKGTGSSLASFLKRGEILFMYFYLEFTFIQCCGSGMIYSGSSYDF